ncbi:hypothetical protein Z043_124894 [Scleropages formosus]|nr:hypothetical protein Z043_124894 [Scleropages formosus]
MKAMCKQGYTDALHFIKKNGLLQFRRPQRGLLVRVERMEEQDEDEEEEDDTEEEGGDGQSQRQERQVAVCSSGSATEDHIFDHLPPRLHRALVEACKERRGMLQSLRNLLPVRMASALLIPYTLPLESAMSMTVRLLEWLPDVQEDVGWMRDQTMKVLHCVVRQARKTVSQQVSER